MMRRVGVVLVGALAVVSVVAASGCSGEQRSAAGPSSDAASVSAAASSAASLSVSESPVGVPDAPVGSQWRSLPTHEVRWSLWTPKDAPVSGVEAVVVNGASQAEPVACDADANASTKTRSYWSCSLIARQGQRTVRARAVNASGVSE